MNLLSSAAGTVLNLLLPPSCMECDAPTDGPFRLCAACFGHYHLLTDPLCATCGVPFAHGGQRGPGGRCPACLVRPPHFARARAALAYDTHTKPLLLAFKYADRTELARLFAPMMARAGTALLANTDWLVPVPLHVSRLRQRGYNQAALLCRALTRGGAAPTLADALLRTRRTAPLGGMDVPARAAAMRGAIAPNPARIPGLAGRRILLVDDVMTSGATLNACAEALRAAGATHVDALVAARVPDPTIDL